MHCFMWMPHGCLGFREDDAEKLGKGEEDAAVAVSAEASQTMPQVPITTPPPPVTDMSGQAAYGAYSSWYQVGSHRYIAQNCQQTFDFCVTPPSFFLPSSPSTAAMATRTPGTTTRVIILPARRGGGNRDCDSSRGHRKQFYLI